MLERLQNFGKKIFSFFGEPEGSDSISKQEMEKVNGVFSGNSLSHILPYESYEENSGLFIGKNSVGFVIEAIPFVGCDDATEKEISSLFLENLEEGASMQCLLWADHRVSSFLALWEKARKNSAEIFQEMSRKRSEFFMHSGKVSPRIFRFILSYSIPLTQKLDENIICDLNTKKEKILKTLKSLTYAYSWDVDNFLETVGGMLNFSRNPELKKRKWNPYQTLASQLTTGGSLQVEEDCLEWNTDSDTVFRSYRVVDFPEYWSLSAMQRLIGDVFRDSFRIHSPFYLHYGVHCPKQSKSENDFWTRSQMVEKQGSSRTLLRMIPDLETELRECDYIRKALNEGSHFVWTQFSTGVWCQKDLVAQEEQSIKSIFRTNQFSLVENNYLHLPQFLSCLPMTWPEYITDLKALNLLKTTVAQECGNFVPIQGEWMGTSTPGMLFAGRRGQIVNWNPFDNRAGNYNVVVVGTSGSGKSVFMQDLLLNGLGVGAKVFVIEVGRSFEKMCDVSNGQYIEFSKHSNICLNPFTRISLEDAEERDAAFSSLKCVISCMAAPIEGTTDYENALIEQAIRHAWDSKKNKATITDVASWLLSHGDQRAKTLGTMLTPYTKTGIYAKYFENENNINFENQMVLIELEELKEKKDLQSVVVQLFIMSITNQTFLGDRKTPFYICIDEAWDLLRGKQTGVFIETLARRLRKYFGSLVIGTQSIDDFYSTPGALAAFENSDWACLLAQKKSSITRLMGSGRLEMDEYKKHALASVTSKSGEYSEIMICGTNGSYSINRLILDPFSRLLYSTTAQEYSQLKDLTKKGIRISEAINMVLAENEK